MKLRLIGFVESEPAVIDPHASGVDHLDLAQRNLDALAEPDLHFRGHGARRHHPSDRRDRALESRMGRRIARSEDCSEDCRHPERHTTTKSAHNIRSATCFSSNYLLRNVKAACSCSRLQRQISIAGLQYGRSNWRKIHRLKSASD